MPHTFRKKYSNQLPKFARISLERIVSFIGSIASVAGIAFIFLSWDKLSDDKKYFAGLTYLFLIICALILYILIRESGKKHRYAQAIYHIHFVNHTIRDYLAGTQIGKKENLSDILIEIVDAIASGFSIIEGRQCRCSIKELTEEDRPQLKTEARDSISNASSRNTAHHNHYLDENTDFSSLWHGTNGNVRFYKGINLKKIWRKGAYENSSFKVYGDPERCDVLGFNFVTNWNLPYNSAMIWPIRYIPDHQYWPVEAGMPNQQLGPLQQPDFWGFLCIDADTSRAFGSQQACELGALFADALYTLFRQMAYMADPSALPPMEGGDKIAGQGALPALQTPASPVGDLHE